MALPIASIYLSTSPRRTSYQVMYMTFEISNPDRGPWPAIPFPLPTPASQIKLAQSQQSFSSFTVMSFLLALFKSTIQSGNSQFETPSTTDHY